VAMVDRRIKRHLEDLQKHLLVAVAVVLDALPLMLLVMALAEGPALLHLKVAVATEPWLAKGKQHMRQVALVAVGAHQVMDGALIVHLVIYQDKADPELLLSVTHFKE
jgi:hypothetical protein